MDVQHAPGSDIVDLQVKVVKGYCSVGTNGSRDPYTKISSTDSKGGLGEDALKRDFF